jgi:hypothetical protein
VREFEKAIDSFSNGHWGIKCRHSPHSDFQ